MQNNPDSLPKGSCSERSKLIPAVWVLGAFVVVVLAASSFIDLPFWPFTAKKYITVIGYYQAQQNNETARFSATVTTKNSSKETAVKDATDKSQKLIDSLKTFGIADKDIKTQNINIYQDQEMYYDNGVQKYRNGAWNVSMTVEMTLRDVTKAPTLTELLAKLEISNMWGPNFSAEQGATDEVALLAKAFDNAQVKADGLARTVGKRLGGVISITEGYQSALPIFAYKDAGMGSGGGGIEPGTSDVSKTVTVTFELK